MITRATASPELLRKLDAVLEIKQCYYVGSERAYKFCAVEREYERLRDAVRETESLYRPTAKELKSVINRAHTLVGYYLEYLAVKSSEPEKQSLTTISEITVLPYAQVFVRELEAIAEELESKYKFKEEEYLWRFDYLEFVRNYCSLLPISLGFGPKEDRLRLALLVRAFRHATASSYKYLQLVSTSERISFEEYEKEYRLRKPIGSNYILISEGDEEKQVFITPGNHAYYQEFLLEKGMSILEGILAMPLLIDYPTEELEFLLDERRLYRRAKDELKLGLLEIERQIALSLALGCQWDESGLKLGAKETVGQAIKVVGETLDRRRRSLEKDRRLDIPMLVQRRESLVEEARYLLLALRKNRPWLIEFFSH